MHSVSAKIEQRVAINLPIYCRCRCVLRLPSAFIGSQCDNRRCVRHNCTMNIPHWCFDNSILLKSVKAMATHFAELSTIFRAIVFTACFVHNGWCIMPVIPRNTRAPTPMTYIIYVASIAGENRPVHAHSEHAGFQSDAHFDQRHCA